MLLKELTISAGRSGDAAADKARHDFAENRGVILRFRTLCRFFDAEMPKCFAQPRKRASVERARQIVSPSPINRSKYSRRKLSSFALPAASPSAVCDPERACVAAQQCQASDHLGIGTA